MAIFRHSVWGKTLQRNEAESQLEDAQSVQNQKDCNQNESDYFSTATTEYRNPYLSLVMLETFNLVELRGKFDESMTPGEIDGHPGKIQSRNQKSEIVKNVHTRGNN